MQNRSQIDAKSIPDRCQIDPRSMPDRSQIDAKSIPDRCQIDPRSMSNRSQMSPGRHQDAQKSFFGNPKKMRAEMLMRVVSTRPQMVVIWPQLCPKHWIATKMPRITFTKIPESCALKHWWRWYQRRLVWMKSDPSSVQNSESPFFCEPGIEVGCTLTPGGFCN